MTFLTLVLIAVIFLAVIGLGWQTFTVAVLDGFDRTLDVAVPIIRNLTQEAYAWPAGTTEEQKNTILNAANDTELPLEEWTIADDFVYTLWDRANEAELQALEDCGFVEAVDASIVLQCYRDKGYSLEG